MPQTPAGGHDDLRGKCEQQAAGDPAGGPLGGFGEGAPVPELDRKAPYQQTGRGELDEAVDAERRVMLCAAIPAAMATMASTVIHATVNHSRRNASQISAARSGSGAPATRAGVSQQFCAIARPQTANF